VKGFLSLLFLLAFVIVQSSPILASRAYRDGHSNKIVTDSLSVLNILENKCNVCHRQKKQMVFTSDNMAAYYLLINDQVFVKKRMPKGRNFKLTQAEQEVLLKWIQNIKD